jgi:hypothetical protein
MLPPPANPSLAHGSEMPNPRLAMEFERACQAHVSNAPPQPGVRSPPVSELDRRENTVPIGKDYSPRPGSCSAAL